MGINWKVRSESTGLAAWQLYRFKTRPTSSPSEDSKVSHFRVIL